MDLWQHAAISTAASAGIWFTTDNAPAAAAFFATGVLVDMDHWIDYWRDHGLHLKVGEFFAYFEEGRPPHLWLVGHAWEYSLGGLALCWALGAPLWAWSACLGHLVHLMLDQATNNFRPLGYSMLYRMRVGFDSDHVFNPPKPGDNATTPGAGGGA